MYDELYAAWRLEIENGELCSLPPDFYAHVAEYLRRIKEEKKMQDKKTVLTSLIEREDANVKRMAKELLVTRYRKLMKMLMAGRKISADSLATEEATLYNGLGPSAEAYGKFVDGIMEGHVVKLNIEPDSVSEPPMVHMRMTLRFLKPVPSIIGADMKSYGPFQVEDVASVPIENAKILIKQGLAKQVELQ